MGRARQWVDACSAANDISLWASLSAEALCAWDPDAARPPGSCTATVSRCPAMRAVLGGIKAHAIANDEWRPALNRLRSSLGRRRRRGSGIRVRVSVPIPVGRSRGAPEDNGREGCQPKKKTTTVAGEPHSASYADPQRFFPRKIQPLALADARASRRGNRGETVFHR